MFTEKFIHQVNSLIEYKANDLLDAQKIATAAYNRQSGAMSDSLSQRIAVSNMSLILNYPLHIRFLDMKNLAKKRKKAFRMPTYNRHVYGNLYIGIYNKLRKGLSGIIVSSFIKEVGNE